jgi:hypothetical protein
LSEAPAGVVRAHRQKAPDRPVAALRHRVNLLDFTYDLVGKRCNVFSLQALIRML